MAGFNILDVIQAHTQSEKIAHCLIVDADLIRNHQPVQASYNGVIDGVPGTMSILWQPVPEGGSWHPEGGAMPVAVSGAPQSVEEPVPDPAADLSNVDLSNVEDQPPTPV